MTKKEAARVIMLLQVGYPDTFKDMSDDALKAMISLWAELFTEPYEVVLAAVKKFMKTSCDRFMPTPGAITDIIYSEDDNVTEAEAWAQVRKAVTNGHNATEEYNKLSPLVRKAVGSPAQLHEWGMMEIDHFNSFVQTNFLRMYRTVVKRDIENRKTPDDVKRILGAKIERIGSDERKEISQ